MLIKPDKSPSQTTSYWPISLLSAIMKLFEWVIEKRLRKHLEDNGFFSKYQSSFRKSKSTNDHLFHLSQTIMESFNRGEHVIAAFLDVEKAFDNVWHNGLRYKIYQLDLPTKLCRWLSDFLVGRVIQVKIEGFLSPKVYPKAGVPQGSNLSPLLFLIYVNDMQNPVTTRLTSRNLQMTPANGLWVKNWFSSGIFAKGSRQTGKVVCQMENKTKSRENKSRNILQVPIYNKGRTCFIFIWQPPFVLSSNKILRYHIWQ